MTQDEIIEMARQAHYKLVTEVYVGHMGQLNPWTIELLKIFAQLVATKAIAELESQEPVAYLCTPDENGLFGFPTPDRGCKDCFPVYRYPPQHTEENT
jgi:hypothetical protein